MILPVILCGGSGTRLWPLSRKAYPKQLLSLSTGHSMLQETLLRLSSIPDLLPPVVLCNEAHRFIVAEQLLEMGVENAKIILEPCARNTAPATTIAALESDNESLLLVLPADHQIKNVERFCEAVSNARAVVEEGYLVTFGIQPERAETGYGYIKKGPELANSTGYKAAKFVEKPDADRARQYIESGEYYWNSGMFMFRASSYLEELAKFSPETVTVCRQALQQAKKDPDFVRISEEVFANCKNDSIDYAVMEKSEKVAVIPLNESGWSDLGSWDSIYDSKDKDSNNNVIKGDVHTENVTNSYLHAENRLLTVVGVSDHIIIETADAVLVAHKDAAQDIKKMVSSLGIKKRSEVEQHRRVHRPWGYYEVLDSEAQFQVKRIYVKPNASLSLQMHYYRSEHWVVTQGTAEVTCGDKCFTLKENQSTYIPAQEKHRLKNKGTEGLMLIEIQTGSYLGEDDIVRFEDHYGREVKLTT